MATVANSLYRKRGGSAIVRTYAVGGGFDGPRALRDAAVGGAGGVTTAGFDVLTMGRVGVDFYPTEPRQSSWTSSTSTSSSGAARPTSRSPRRASASARAVITRTGPDPFGEYVHAALREFGVDDRYVSRRRGAADPGHLLRDVPAGPLPHLLLPGAEGAGPRDLPRGARPRRDCARRACSGRRSAGSRPSRAGRRPWPRSAPRRASTPPSSTSTTARRSGPSPATPRAGDARGPRATRPSPSATSTRSRSPSARATPTSPPTDCSTSDCDLAVVKLGPDGVLAKTRDERVEVPPVPVRSRQRSRRGRRLRRVTLPRGARRLATRDDAALRERRRGDRRVAPRLLGGHAHGR